MSDVSEMALDQSVSVNIERHAAVALEAAKAASAAFLDKHGGDISRWTPQQYHEFVWITMISGLMAAANATTVEYRRIIAGLDAIPY